jgi:hypothetical protein
MLPGVVPEQSVCSFHFYAEGDLRQGMRHQRHLFKLVQIFNAQQRSPAYALGCDLAEEGDRVVITASKDAYKVWQQIISPDAPRRSSSTNASLDSL